MSAAPLRDEQARHDVQFELAENAFVAAGAGTGKSTTLVGRIVHTVTSGPAPTPIRRIAAITFTERAAGELRDRVRAALAKRAAANPDETASHDALVDVDAAAIGTIHGFALAILREHALAAGLPLGFGVVDDVVAGDARQQRWRGIVQVWRDRLPADSLAFLGAAGIRLVDLRDLVDGLDQARAQLDPARVRPADLRDVGDLRDDVVTGLRRLVDEALDECADESDKLAVHLATVVRGLSEDLHACDEPGLVELHGAWRDRWPRAFTPGGVGTARAWGSRGRAKEWRDQLKEWCAPLEAALAAPLENVLREAVAIAWEVLDRAAVERVRAGELEFDDLLLVSRALLRDDAVVRAAVSARFQVVLVDEFQDTDPVQWEIVRLITSDPSDPSAVPQPGRLVVVGDPKQAIYSFRGADIRTYLQAREDFPGRLEHLITNFRSVAAVIGWVNEVFSAAMAESDFQSAYEPLEAAHDPAVTGHPGPPVLVLRDAPPPDADADSDADADADSDERPLSSALEPRLVAAAIRRAVDDGWQVTEPAPGWSRAYTRTCGFRDIAILAPVRTGTPALLDALDDAGVPYRSSDTTLVYGRPTISGLLAALRAIGEPDDELSLWWALKSPLFGCGDDDLLAYRRSGGTWRVPPADAEPGDGPVRAALRILAELRSTWVAPQPADVLASLVERCRVHEILAVFPRGGFDSDCVRMVVAHAQSFQDDGGVGLGDYLAWVEQMTDGTSRASLPEPDDRSDDAVRLMTVHASKGLEFPIVVLAGMATGRRAVKPTVGVRLDGALEFHTTNVTSRGYNPWNDEVRSPREDAELLRLLYVACTRARDHLIISVVGEKHRGPAPRSGILRAEVDAVTAEVLDTPPDLPPRSDAVPPTDLPPLPDGWSDTVAQVRALAARPWVASPSGSGAAALDRARATGGQPDAVPDGWSDDRAAGQALAERDGRPLGRAVHAALDTLFGATHPPTDDELAAACRRAVVVEGIPDALAGVRTRVAAAMRTDLAAEVFRAPRRWTELYLAAPVDHDGVRLVEGYADLVFDTPGGLVLVDHKTDATLSPDSMAHYRGQLAAYAELLERASGRPVVRRVILHVPGNQARAIELAAGSV